MQVGQMVRCWDPVRRKRRGPCGRLVSYTLVPQGATGRVLSVSLNDFGYINGQSMVQVEINDRQPFVIESLARHFVPVNNTGSKSDTEMQERLVRV